jgi:Protein of unknown function (DUF4242)
MKILFAFTVFAAAGMCSATSLAQQAAPVNHVSTNLYLDVHHMGAGKVTAKDVAAAHQKDLAVQNKYGVNFIKYWVDEAKGDIYCLASAPDSQSLSKTHAEAHGLLPDQINEVTDGAAASEKGKKDFFLDLHEFGPGKVSAIDVAGAHKKDLAVEKKYGVNFINYWVDEKNGTVVCLAQAPNAGALINTHKKAHGLIPVSVVKVKQGK